MIELNHHKTKEEMNKKELESSIRRAESIKEENDKREKIVDVLNKFLLEFDLAVTNKERQILLNILNGQNDAYNKALEICFELKIRFTNRHKIHNFLTTYLKA